MNKNASKYTPKSKNAPVYFVDPATGDVIALNLNTVEFSK